MSQTPQQAKVDTLLDRAVQAINSGNRAQADALAEDVLAVDHANAEAEELLAAPADHGELRRLTIMFADLVDSTALSTRIEPETYRTVVGRYRDEVLRNVDAYDGHVGNTKGDGLLAIFGHPHAHEDDVHRAVQAGLDITRAVAQLSARVKRRFGFDISVRVGVHRGLVYLDTAQDDVYGLAANLAARICSIADAGCVAVSSEVQQLVRDSFELVPGPAQSVKGIDGVIVPYRVVAERHSTPAPLGPLIGRDDEVDRLRSAWQQATAGSLAKAGVALCGEPGIGKSRLARTALDFASQSGGVVLELTASPFHTRVGLHPVRTLLEHRCGIARGADSADSLRLLRAEVEALSLDPEPTIALLAPVLAITPDKGYQPAPAEGDKLAERITGAVHEYLIACTHGKPALILAEDMHWFDPSTSAVIASLLRADLGRVLIVMTSRNAESLPDTSLLEVIELAPLNAAETEQLIVALDPGIGDSIRNEVHRRCDGVPLYIEEIVAKRKTQPADAASSTQVPDTLYEALFARLQSSEQALRVAEAAATIGNQIDYELLRSVTGLSDQGMSTVMHELRDNLVLEPARDGIWKFRHELLREVAAELPPPSIRRRLHSRVADALKLHAADADPDWPIIARHYERAERYDEAVTAHQRAYSTARRRGALKEALAHLAQALDQLDHLPPGTERDHREVYVRLRHGLLTSAVEGAGSSRTAADFERCLQLSGTDPHTDELFATLMALFAYYVNRADLRRAEQVVQSLRHGVDGGREWWRAENLAGSGIVSWSRGDFTEARKFLEDAARLTRSREQHDVEAEWFMPFDPLVLDLTSLAQARFVAGDMVAADAALADARARASDIGFPQGPVSMCYALYIETMLAIESGLHERAAAAAAETTAQAVRHGFDQWIAVGAVIQACADAALLASSSPVDTDRLSKAITVLTGWTNAARFLEVKFLLTWFDGVLARSLLAVGNPDDARRQLDAGLQLADETGMHFFDSELLRLRAATQTDAAARLSDLEAALSLAQRQGAPVFALRAALDIHERRGEVAIAAVAQAVAELPTDANWPELDRARGILD